MGILKNLKVYSLDELLDIRDALDILKTYDFEFVKLNLGAVNAELEERYGQPNINEDGGQDR